MEENTISPLILLPQELLHNELTPLLSFYDVLRLVETSKSLAGLLNSWIDRADHHLLQRTFRSCGYSGNVALAVRLYDYCSKRLDEKTIHDTNLYFAFKDLYPNFGASGDTSWERKIQKIYSGLLSGVKKCGLSHTVLNKGGVERYTETTAEFHHLSTQLLNACVDVDIVVLSLIRDLKNNVDLEGRVWTIAEEISKNPYQSFQERLFSQSVAAYLFARHPLRYPLPRNDPSRWVRIAKYATLDSWLTIEKEYTDLSSVMSDPLFKPGKVADRSLWRYLYTKVSEPSSLLVNAYNCLGQREWLSYLFNGSISAKKSRQIFAYGLEAAKKAGMTVWACKIKTTVSV